MKLSEIKLFEAPLADVSYHKAATTGSFSASDLKLIKKYMESGHYKDKLKGLPFDLYLYIVDNGDEGAAAADSYPEGEVIPSIWKDQTRKLYHKTDRERIEGGYEPDPDGLDFSVQPFPAIFAAVRERIQKNPNSVHFLLGDNYSDEHQMGVTPWIVAHRLCHCYSVGGGVSVPPELIAAYKKKKGIPAGEAFTAGWKALQASLTFKSAKSNKLIESETSVEMNAQFLVTGDIPLDLPAYSAKLKELSDVSGFTLTDDEIVQQTEIWNNEVSEFKDRCKKAAERIRGKVFYV
jgi:hypothetical protein